MRDKDYCKNRLRELFRNTRPGTKRATVYCIYRGRSASGMTHWLDPYIIRDGELLFIGGLVAGALGYTYSDARSGIAIGGCGFNKAHHIVYELSHLLFPKRERGGYVLRHQTI